MLFLGFTCQQISTIKHQQVFFTTRKKRAHAAVKFILFMLSYFLLFYLFY